MMRAIRKMDYWIGGLLIRFMFYPWRCLWRALVQITRMTPLRRMILQFSQSFLTDARTFISLTFSQSAFN